MCDRVNVMYLGKVVESGTKEDMFKNPLHPYTEALLSSSRCPTRSLKRDRIVLSGDVPSPANPPSGCRFHTRCRYREEICESWSPRWWTRGTSTSWPATSAEGSYGHQAGPAKRRSADRTGAGAGGELVHTGSKGTYARVLVRASSACSSTSLWCWRSITRIDGLTGIILVGGGPGGLVAVQVHIYLKAWGAQGRWAPMED